MINMSGICLTPLSSCGLVPRNGGTALDSSCTDSPGLGLWVLRFSLRSSSSSCASLTVGQLSLSIPKPPGPRLRFRSVGLGAQVPGGVLCPPNLRRWDVQSPKALEYYRSFIPWMHLTGGPPDARATCPRDVLHGTRWNTEHGGLPRFEGNARLLFGASQQRY